MSTMLILRGIRGTFGGRNYPNGALDEWAALEYARRLGYQGRVLDIHGATGPSSPQTRKAVDVIRWDTDITALYGFSGGGYNARHIWATLTPLERARIQRIIVVGSPGVGLADFRGCAGVMIFPDPKEGHMVGPQKLLESLGPERIHVEGHDGSNAEAHDPRALPLQNAGWVARMLRLMRMRE